MTPRKILAQTRGLIAEHAGDDPDKWWYANRFVFARLGLDERKTKAGIKKRLLEAFAPCHGCGEEFQTKRDVHLHRLDVSKGYSDENCVLMHAECHRGCHSSQTAGSTEKDDVVKQPVVVKQSKRYDDMSFVYWWDIAPNLAESLDQLEMIEFVKKDTRERCAVPVQALKVYLTPDRQSSRSANSWGVRVLNDRPDELAFEPGVGGGEWLFLPVVWLDESDD